MTDDMATSSDDPGEASEASRLYCQGVEFAEQQAYERAAQCWLEAANRGHHEAQYNLGVLHVNGLGVSRSHTKAADLWRSAAAAGHTGAQFNLGLCCQNGDGAPRSTDAARELFEKVARAEVSNDQLPMPPEPPSLPATHAGRDEDDGTPRRGPGLPSEASSGGGRGDGGGGDQAGKRDDIVSRAAPPPPPERGPASTGRSVHAADDRAADPGDSAGDGDGVSDDVIRTAARAWACADDALSDAAAEVAAANAAARHSALARVHADGAAAAHAKAQRATAKAVLRTHRANGAAYNDERQQPGAPVSSAARYSSDYSRFDDLDSEDEDGGDLRDS